MLVWEWSVYFPLFHTAFFHSFICIVLLCWHNYPARACAAGVKQCLCVKSRAVLYAVISATSYYRFRGSIPFEIARGSYGQHKSYSHTRKYRRNRSGNVRRGARGKYTLVIHVITCLNTFNTRSLAVCWHYYSLKSSMQVLTSHSISNWEVVVRL